MVDLIVISHESKVMLYFLKMVPKGHNVDGKLNWCVVGTLIFNLHVALLEIPHSDRLRCFIEILKSFPPKQRVVSASPMPAPLRL